MSATIIDIPEDDASITETDNHLSDQPQDTLEAIQPEEVTEEANDLPEKYQNKSVEDLVRMHQEAEKLVGRQGDEVGQLRRVVDDYIQQEIDKREDKTESVEEIDFFTDPDKAIESKINNHPAVKQAMAQAEKFNQASNLANLQRKYPKMEGYLQDDKFKEWVEGTDFRKALYTKANNEYDFQAADEMFGLWEERVSLVNQTATMEASDRSNQVRKASTGSGSGSRAGNGKKVYRRADIIKLMSTDPERYASMADEIQQAYADGRVK